MSLPENMPSPGMDSPYILRLLFPDRNADRNARAFPGPGVFRSTTSRQPPLGSLACRWHESTTSGVAGRGRRHLRGPETPGCRHLRGPETPDSDLYIFGDVLKYLVCIRADARSLNININPGISITAGTPRQHPRGPEPLNRAEPIRIISISLRRI